MRKLLALGLAVFAIIAPLPTATAATPVIRLTDIPHRNFDGTFRDNQLADLLAINGRLGKPLYAAKTSATWVIDAHLIDEVIDMADGYTFNGEEDAYGSSIAQLWLQQLRIVTQASPIVALPYGNPDTSLARRLSASELKYYFAVGEAKLTEFFGRPVISQNGWGTGKSRLEREYQGFYRSERSLLQGLNKVVDLPEVTHLRQHLGVLLNPTLSYADRSYFSLTARTAVQKVASKLKVVSGRYQLTSEFVKVPLTLVNKFETTTTVSLSLIPMNSRVRVENVHGIILPPKSQIQISVPFQVIASGNTVLLAQFMTPQGDFVGEVSRLNLTLTVIDSRVTWFTTGAALLLFLGAVAQSVRRIRRSRHEK